MSPEVLDVYLKKRTRKICIVLISIILVSVVVAIAFDTAYYRSAEAKVYEYTILGGVFTREETYYNEYLKFGIAGGLIVGCIALLIAIEAAFLYKHRTFELDGNSITIHASAITGTSLYINGECKDTIYRLSSRFHRLLTRYYLEGKTPDGILVTVNLNSSYHMHITFSNGHPPLDF